MSLKVGHVDGLKGRMVNGNVWTAVACVHWSCNGIVGGRLV